MTRIYTTTSEAYLVTVGELVSGQDFLRCSPRGQPCRELADHHFEVVEPTSDPIQTASEARNAVIADYLAKEKRLYLSGELRAEVWAAEASRFWAKLANPDGTINSNYGWLALRNQSLPNGLTPWEWVKQSLLNDNDSRQAYLRISLPGHQWLGNKDQVCTMHVNFLLRDGLLRATTVTRSNDVFRGLVYDMPWFVYLQERMAEELGVGIGTYGHFAHSMHLYERDLDKAKEMLP